VRSLLPRPAVVALAVAALIGTLAGCAVSVRPGTATVAAPPPILAPGPADRAAYTDLGPLQEDADTAVSIVDRFWKAHWNDSFTGTYTSPRVLGAYDPRARSNPDDCGPLVPQNALYCPDGDFVGWDAGLIRKADRYGDSWIYLVIAHEWGHAVQERVEIGLRSQAAELQADCLGAAALYGSATDGLLRFEENDEKEIVQGLAEIGDQTPWTMAADHGDSFQRIAAFTAGRDGGVPACLPMAQASPQPGR
jgi:predicted metalloprotease